MKKYLRKYYPEENVFVTEEYILCKGNVPIMLVAHMDTVFKSPPKKIRKSMIRPFPQKRSYKFLLRKNYSHSIVPQGFGVKS